MKLIPLKGKHGLGKSAQVDDEDYECLMKFNWSVVKKSDTLFYAIRGTSSGNKKMLFRMHREVMGYKNNDKKITDHKDGNGLNNQKSNLRASNFSQNGANRKASGSSEYLGVYIRRVKYKTKNGEVRITNPVYVAQITVNGKCKRIGLFKSEENAAIAYNIMAERYHGEFANYNKTIQTSNQCQ